MLSRRLLLLVRWFRLAPSFSASTSQSVQFLLSYSVVRPELEAAPSSFTGLRRQLLPSCTSRVFSHARKEPAPGFALVNRIVDELENKGTKFILPTNDASALEAVAEPFRLLVDAGVDPEFLVETCVKSVDFFCALVKHGRASLEIIGSLIAVCHWRYADAVEVFSCFPDELLAVGAESVQKNLEVLINCGVEPGQSLQNAVLSHPAVLFAKNPAQMGTTADAISAFFSKPQLRNIVNRFPQILLYPAEETESKYEYIYFHMGIEGQDFKNCRSWIDTPLEDIITRHEFLVKTGKYVFPDPKRPQLKMENPDLPTILDSSDAHFAEDVAGVSIEEWEVYNQLAEKLRKQSDMDVPFERVKPSMRKAFERRLKYEKEVEPFKFESGT